MTVRCFESRMKRRIFISLCFALTFALGGVAGWLLKPTPPAAASLDVSPGQRLLQQLGTSLQLTAAQKKAMRPICEDWGNQSTAIGKRPHQRTELFEQFVPRIRELLTTNQLPRLDKFVAEVRSRPRERKGR